MFNADQEADDLESKIQEYFQVKIKGEHINLLNYWHSNQAIFPSMAAMAPCFLAIPTTSSSSKQVFSKCKAIIGPQRAILSSESIEHLLCLKECYLSICVVDPAPYNKAHDFHDA